MRTKIIINVPVCVCYFAALDRSFLAVANQPFDRLGVDKKENKKERQINRRFSIQICIEYHYRIHN